MTTEARPKCPVEAPARESLDDHGAGDHDAAFVFGRLPRALAPFPFSTRQFARLLIVRGRISAACSDEHQRSYARQSS